jgi:tetratricopeptide (TPR) repeat protein
MRQPTLLIFDDVASEQALREWLPPPVLPVHLLVTSTSCDWSTDHRTHRLDRLPAKDALALVEHVAGKSICDDYGSTLLHRTGGLPTYLKPAARHVRYEVARRRVPDLGLEDWPEADAGLLRALERLSPDTRLWLRAAALFNPTQVPPQALGQLLEAEGWDTRRRHAALDGALDRLLVSETRDGLRMHGLVADFLRHREAGALPQALKRRHWQAFLSLARDFGKSPGDGELRAKIFRYPAQVALWLTLTDPPDWNDLWSVGLAIIETGRYEAASEWFARALDTAERALGSSLACHADIGRCLHYLGMCEWALKEYARALPFFERAARESVQGNGEGLVDHARVAGNLHQQAYCLEELGRLDEALACFQRSIEQTRRGTLSGAVDEANVGKGLHHVGCCQRRLGRLQDACETLLRAVDAKSKGHADGRIDHDSIGRSLHELGECWFSLEDVERARSAFTSAIDAKLLGDGHRRVDRDHIGLSQHRLADCLARLGQLEAALTAYEAAAASRRIGDVHGAIDQEGIGSSLQAIGDCWLALHDAQRARTSYEQAVEARALGHARGHGDLRSPELAQPER